MRNPILIVEDDPIVSSLLSTALESAGMRAEIASTLGEASRNLKTSPYAAVLLDLYLPDGLGWSLLEEMKVQNSLIPVLIVTAEADEQIMAEAVRCGAAGCIKKTEGFVRNVVQLVTAVIELAEERQKNARIAALVASAGDAIATSGLDGCVIDWNLGAERLYGYKAEEMKGKNVRSLMPPPHDKDVGVNVATLAAGQSIIAFETVRLRKDGTTFDASVTLSPVFDARGEVIAVSSITRDITEQKRAEKRVREMEAHLKLALTAAKCATWERSLKTNVYIVSDEHHELYGLPERIEWTVEKLLASAHPDDRERLRTAIAGSSTKRSPRTTEYRVVWPDGSVHWLLSRSTGLLDAAGKPERVLGVVMDVTDVRTAENALRERERELSAIFTSAMDGMSITDDEGKFTNVNPAYCTMLGAAREELIGRPWRPIEPSAHAWIDIETQFKMTGRASGQIPVRRKDGKIIDTEVSAIANVTPGRHLTVVRDITEKKRLEEQFRQSQKMEAIGRLAGGVAHDFNNLLSVIIGYTELLMKKLDPADPMYARLEPIRKAGSSAATLTRQLLAFSRKQVLEPRVLDLGRVVMGVDKMLRRLIGEDIELATVIPGDLGSVKVDPGQIEQVILNLAVNARDAMPNGGKLVIEIRNTTVEEREGPNVVPPGAYVMLSVRDEGCGMDDSVKAHLFEPFFTTKELGKGTGLGLATVYGIVQQSGGYITVESAPGKGTTFCIFLRRHDTGSHSEAGGPSFEPLPRGSETILVVEDSESLRKMTEEILSLSGYRVLSASNGKEALRIIEGVSDPIQLMLTDILMPGMNGRELASRAQSLRSSMKVLYMSGYAEDLLSRGSSGETLHYLAKPFTPDTLAKKIRLVLDGETP